MEWNELYHDRDIAVVYKPPLLDSETDMPARLAATLGGEVFCVHRLDRGVGGVMVYARTKAAAAALSREIAEGGLEKEYDAVLCGAAEEAGDYRDLLFHDRGKNKTFVVKRERRGVKEARLSFRRLGMAETEQGVLSYVRITLHTGRTHQIRVQFASRKLSLVGDARYGSPIREGNIALLSRRIAFTHPKTHERMEFTAEAPQGFPWSAFANNDE